MITIPNLMGIIIPKILKFGPHKTLISCWSQLFNYRNLVSGVTQSQNSLMTNNGLINTHGARTCGHYIGKQVREHVVSTE